MASKSRYHHGDLRAALLEQGQALLAEVGPDAFSLNELARRIGVSSAAPYRHFEDRNAILDAIADEGYGHFHAGLKQAIAESADAGDAIRRIGIAYLRFAARHPSFFKIMFRDRDGRPHDVGPASFETLVDTVAAAQGAGRLYDGMSPRVMARSIWAILHGAATLEDTGGFAKLDLSAPHEQLVDELLATFLRDAPR